MHVVHNVCTTCIRTRKQETERYRTITWRLTTELPLETSANNTFVQECCLGKPETSNLTFLLQELPLLLIVYNR